jgi:hypothetical protein
MYPKKSLGLIFVSSPKKVTNSAKVLSANSKLSFVLVKASLEACKKGFDGVKGKKKREHEGKKFFFGSREGNCNRDKKKN